MKQLILQWREDKLKFSLIAVWLLSVFFSIFGDSILSVSVPAVGALYPFRVLIPITAILFIIWSFKEKINPWKDSSFLEKMCYIFILILIVYGAISLLFAIDFSFTFKRLFNLCFDLCFFFLMLRICKDKKALKYTFITAIIGLIILCALGIHETYSGGIFSTQYDGFKRFVFFSKIFQFPVVTFANTNDYASTIVFFISSIVAVWGVDYASKNKKRLLIPIILLPACFYLTLASDARLVMASLLLVFIGVILFFIIGDIKKIWVPIISVVLCLVVLFANYYYIFKPYVEKIFPPEQVVAPVTHAPSSTLKEEFVVENKETGETKLNTYASGGIRTSLLLHSIDCFIESKGMGVGLGNTEQLAKINEVTGPIGMWSIHCFAARLIADYGIWALIPLCIIGIKLLIIAIKSIINAIKQKSNKKAALAILLTMLLLTYPFLSTASSDAQDLISMWLYLGTIVLIFNDTLNINSKETQSLDPPKENI